MSHKLNKSDISEHQQKSSITDESVHHCGCHHTDALADESPQPEKTISAEDISTRIRIMQMDCPVEEKMLKKVLLPVSAVKALEFNLIERVLTVTHAPDGLNVILAAIRSIGFEPELTMNALKSDGATENKSSYRKLIFAILAAAGAELADWNAWPAGVEAALALVAVVLCGLGTYKKGWIAIRHGQFTINALMSIAVTGALLLQEWPEAAMVMVLFTLAELLESKSLTRARNAIGALMNLVPETANIQQPDGSWRDTPIQSVVPGAIIRVRPGERIALDGVIIRGKSSVNQAPITGESMPLDKAPGDTLFAGTINQTGGLEYRATVGAENTTLARIIRTVGQAQSNKGATQRFVDRFAQVYTPLVLGGAVLIALLPPLLFSANWQEWIYKGLVMLVIACPCALVISTPVTLVSGLTAAARKGILIKGGVYLEMGRKIKNLALDKTGTLTWGKPVQTDKVIFNGFSDREVSGIAVSLASYSDHPVSQAIVNAAQDTERYAVEEMEVLVGRGIQGTIGGKKYALGNLRLKEEQIPCPPALKENIQALERSGKTVILLSDETQWYVLFAVADSVRESSREAIGQLHQLGIKTVMLSGDNQHTVDTIASQVGIDQARGEQLPEDKLNAIEQLRAHALTGMVGDGINDAPALAAADIGFAMGAIGTDTAIETADVALMDDDLRKIPAFVQLSRKTHRVLVQNITAALGIKVLFLLLTFTGLGTLWMAVFADVGASLLVVANGLRLLRQ
ncbi:MAG: Cadmium-transporting ATPase [Candidatus Erwinia impunctatus]|nr:Cadmium-transporting ATPase [Culicoides impunctatus]